MPAPFPHADLVQTDMTIPLDQATIHQILHNPPFTPLPRAINIRDLGLLPTSPLPPSLIYRSGAINAASPAALADLGMNTVLDLRSEREVSSHPNPVPSIWVPGTKPPTPIQMERFVDASGVPAYADMYMEIAEICAPAFRRGLEWVRDWEEGRGGMVVHCTGKDRTGVLAALLLSLAGAPRSLIAYDYALTRVGVEPSREVLLQMLKLWNKEWTSETPGMQEFVQVRGEFILAFLDGLDARYGSVVGYLRDVLGFEEGEIGRMRGVLRGGSGDVEGGREG